MSAVLILAATWAACSPSAGGPVATGQQRVEVDIYSGRPNPSWVLSAAQAEGLAEVLDALPPSATPGNAPDVGLGFRGFVVSQQPESLEDAIVYRVLEDRVLVDQNGETEVELGDPDGIVFRYLYDLAQDVLPDEALAALEETGGT